MIASRRVNNTIVYSITKFYIRGNSKKKQLAAEIKLNLITNSLLIVVRRVWCGESHKFFKSFIMMEISFYFVNDLQSAFNFHYLPMNRIFFLLKILNKNSKGFDVHEFRSSSAWLLVRINCPRKEPDKSLGSTNQHNSRRRAPQHNTQQANNIAKILLIYGLYTGKKIIVIQFKTK